MSTFCMCQRQGLTVPGTAQERAIRVCAGHHAHKRQADVSGCWVIVDTHPAQLLLPLPPSMVRSCAFKSSSARTAGDSSLASDWMIHEDKS